MFDHMHIRNFFKPKISYDNLQAYLIYKIRYIRLILLILGFSAIPTCPFMFFSYYLGKLFF